MRPTHLVLCLALPACTPVPLPPPVLPPPGLADLSPLPPPPRVHHGFCLTTPAGPICT